MKILACHNYYQNSGGEDQVFEDECAGLEKAGHQVTRYIRHNDEIKAMGWWAAALDLFWSRKTYQDICEMVEREKPDVIHAHNVFPLISPSIYHAASDCGVPIFLTLHNQRLMCPAGSFVRKGELCLLCHKRVLAWPSVIFGCYRKSRILSLAVAMMVFFHKCIGTWRKKVSCYIASTEFYRRIFVEAGFPADKIKVKPHMVLSDPGERNSDGGYALFIGRLDPEKGIHSLLEGWKVLREKFALEYPLRIRGGGQLVEYTKKYIWTQGLSYVMLISRKSRKELYELIKGAKFLVWPSLGYYETFGLTVIESFACGVPIIASKTGVAAEHVRDGENGIHFEPGNPDDLADKVRFMLQLSDADYQNLCRNARAQYEHSYRREKNIHMLEDIYRSQIQ